VRKLRKRQRAVVKRALLPARRAAGRP
jgi:hypothetical protein